MKADLLLSGGTIITVDATRSVIEDGAVAISGDRIVAIGPRGYVTRAHPARRVIDTRHHLLLPGLIDAHCHAGHGLMRGLAGGDAKGWAEACVAVTRHGASPGFWKSEARLSMLERVMAGITTCVAVLGASAEALRCDDPAHGIAHCQGAAEIGLRAILAVGPSAPPYPVSYAAWDGGQRLDYPVPFERELETMQHLVETCHGRGRTHVALMMPVVMPGTLDLAQTAAVQRQARLVGELRRRHRLLFHQDGHRAGSIELADRGFGLLGPDSFVAPGHDLTEGDIATLERLNVALVHTPASLSSLHGSCPVTTLLEQGVIVALGSDGAAPEHGADPFRAMQLARRLAQLAAHDEAVLPPGKALEMVTIDAARALRMDRDIGSLEPGKKADIITIDLRRPHLAPRQMPPWRLVGFANAGDVDTVVVEGEVLMEGRLLPHVDVGAVLDEAQIASELMLDRVGLRKLLAEPASLWGQTRGRTLRAPSGVRLP